MILEFYLFIIKYFYFVFCRYLVVFNGFFINFRGLKNVLKGNNFNKSKCYLYISNLFIGRRE